MRTSPHLALCAVVVAAASMMTCGITALAEDEDLEAEPQAFSTLSYPLPARELDFGFLSKDKITLKPPARPPTDASPEEQEAFLKSSHEVLKEYLAVHEVPLPSGSLACYDPASDTLSLRTTNATHEMMHALSRSAVDQVPKHLSWRLEIVEAPSADVRAALQQCRGRTEHGKLLDALTSKGTVITMMRGETKGGQQVSARQGSRFRRPTEYATGSSGHVETATEDAFSGLLLELEPVIGDNGSIDLNCSFQYWPAAPKSRLAQLTAGSSPKVEAEWLDFPAFTSNFSSTLWSGQTRLIGVWDLENLADPAKAGRSQAAFLCAHSVSLLPLPDPRLEAMLRERGEAVQPTPKGVRPVADPTLPPGMMVRRFRVPPDFESFSAGEAPTAPADPFASGAAPLNEPRFVRSVTAEDILKSQGIPFPPGASANFLRSSSELVVRNLPENIEFVQAFVDSILGHATKLGQVTVEVIEADATLLRRITREVEALPDHSAAQKALEAEITAGKARVIRTVWVETKGGQAAMWGNVIQTQTAQELGVDSEAPPEPAKKEGQPAAAETKPKTQKTLLSVFSEDEAVGSEVEIDPVIGENGNIDLNILVKADTAPAGSLTAAAQPEPGTQRMASVNPVRRGMEFKTSVTLSNGIPRLVSVYQPTKTEGQSTDVLHAVFVRGDIAELEKTK